MELFEQNGAIYKRVPAGGQGGGVTGSVVVKASEVEAAAFRETASAMAHAASAEPTISLPQADAEAIEAAVAKAVADATHEG